jgi:hypothetical protein
MSAHTIVSALTIATGAGGGLKQMAVSITGSASYDTGGSVLDLSSYFSDEVRMIHPTAQGTAPLGAQYVPDTGNAPATCKVVLIDKDGTEESSTDNMSGTVYDLIVTGTDG